MNPLELDLPYLFDDRFVLKKVLGQGGMGVVFKATDQLLNKEVALKMVHSEVSSKQLIRFQQEAKAIAKFTHRNIVDVLDFASASNGQTYLTMELLEGKSLVSLIDENKQLSADQLLPIVSQILAGLEHAHAQGVLHRDIKPSNIMLLGPRKDQYQVKIVDFGLAKITMEEQSITGDGAAIGSPYYISPEQVSGKEIGTWSDVYSVGCVMYEALTGAVPFQGDSPLSTMAMRLKQIAPRFSVVAPDLDCDQGLEDIVQKCIATQSANRYQTVAELGDAIEQWQKRQEELGLQTEEEEELEKASHQKSNLFFALLALVSIIVAATYFLNRNPIEKESEDINIKFQKSTLPKTSEMVDISKTVPRIDRHGSIRLSVPKSISVFKTLRDEKRLRHLFVEDIDLDDVRLEHISKCQTLTELRIDKNPRITSRGFEKISGLNNLLVLHMESMNADDSFLDTIAKLKGLRVLHLEGNPEISSRGLKKIVGLKHLSSLVLGSTLKSRSQNIKVVDIVEFANSKKELAILGLEVDCAKIDDWRYLSDLKFVQRLELERCANLSPEILEHVVKMKSINSLSLDKTKVDTAAILAINNNPNIVKLSLEKTNLTDETLEVLYKLKYVQDINLIENHLLTKPAMLKLRQIKSLRFINGRHTALGGGYTIKGR